MRRIAASSLIIALFLVSHGAAAFTPPDEVLKHAVMVFCDGRKGSGVVTDGAGGYVVTNGHIAIDVQTGVRAENCDVLLPVGDDNVALSRYRARVMHAVFDEEHDTDFAALQLQQHLAGPPVPIPAGLAVDVFTEFGDPIAVLGYPANAQDVQVTEGTALGYERGMLLSDAEIAPGNSGGPAVDVDGDVVGISTRVRYSFDPETGEQVVIDYGYGDVAALMTWLDTVDVERRHDHYLRHADHDAYHAAPFFLRDEADPGCDHVVRTPEHPAVYCLRTGARRAAFPDSKTFLSWYETFDQVQHITPTNLAEYRLTGLVTHKAGTLVKVTTDPKVYLVTDAIGTLRHVPSEEVAATYFGADWATKVLDVPDAFFPAYVIGAPLD